MRPSYVRVYKNINRARETVLILDKEMPLTVNICEKMYNRIQEQLKLSTSTLYELDKKKQYQKPQKNFLREDNIDFIVGYPMLSCLDMVESRGYIMPDAPVGKNDTIGIVNFGSRRNPGGNFLSGAHNQEGYLCRFTTLFYGLTHHKAAEDYYARGIDVVNGNNFNYKSDVLFTQGNIAIRDMVGNLAMNPRSFAVFTAAPINSFDVVQRHFDMKINHIDFVIHRYMLDLIRSVVNAAIEEGIDHLVFGTIGEEEGHDPVLIANLSKEVLCDEIVYDQKGEECRKRDFFKSISFITPDVNVGTIYQQIFKYDEKLFPDGDPLYHY